MKNKIEVGIIGCGRITTNHHLPLLTTFDNIRVKYMADIRNPKFLAKIYGILGITIENDLSKLPDCDIVLLATPVGARQQYIREFSRRKIAIFTEKPFALNTNQHKTFLSLNDKITCNYLIIYSSNVRQMRAIVESEVFGELKQVYITEGGIVGSTAKEKDHYQTNVDLSGGGILIERGCHTVSVLNYILDRFNIAVKNANIVFQKDLDVDLEAHLQATDNTKHEGFERNVEITYSISLIRPLTTNSKFIFENAELEFNHLLPESVISIKALRHNSYFTIEPNRRWATTEQQTFYLKWKHFLSLIDGGDSMDTAFETSLRTTEVIENIYRVGKICNKQKLQ